MRYDKPYISSGNGTPHWVCDIIHLVYMETKTSDILTAENYVTVFLGLT